jgi:hypothetical protein
MPQTLPFADGSLRLRVSCSGTRVACVENCSRHGCLYRKCRFNALRRRRGDRSTLVDEKSTRSLKHLIEFFGGHFSDGMENDVLLDGKKSLRPDEAWLTDLAAFTIGIVQRNGERIPVRAARDLAENQIRPWQIGNHQSGPAFSGGRIVPRK